jgi:hypothetical protein
MNSDELSAFFLNEWLTILTTASWVLRSHKGLSFLLLSGNKLGHAFLFPDFFFNSSLIVVMTNCCEGRKITTENECQ